MCADALADFFSAVGAGAVRRQCNTTHRTNPVPCAHGRCAEITEPGVFEMMLDKSIAAEKITATLLILLALGVTVFLFFLALADPL